MNAWKIAAALAGLVLFNVTCKEKQKPTAEEQEMQQPAETAPPPKGKATELYSWKTLDSSVWRFSLVPQVKRQKLSDIVAPKRTMVGVDSLLAGIGKLPKSAYIIWLDLPRDTGGAEVVFGYPPDDVMDKVGAACRQHGIRMFVVTPRGMEAASQPTSRP